MFVWSADPRLESGSAPGAGQLITTGCRSGGRRYHRHRRSLQPLTNGEHRVRDLTDHLGLAQSTVSAHLAGLRDCGLVTSRPEGRASLSLTTQFELLDVLAAAERLLEATGYAVELCPTHGREGRSNRARRSTDEPRR